MKGAWRLITLPPPTANVWFHGLDNRNRGRKAPIARTGKLEPKPFLESLPVHRYRPEPNRRR